MDEHDRNEWSSIAMNVAHYQLRINADHGDGADRAKG